jgi:hypothetical protein
LFWRRSKQAPKWFVIVSQVRPLDPHGPGRDELAFPEQRSREVVADSRKAADEIAGNLVFREKVQRGEERVKVIHDGSR